MLVDLHTHSYFSPDGSGTPVQGMAAAKRAGVAVLAVTDHDTVAHIEPCFDAAERVGGVRAVPGVELSLALRAQSIPELHVLCYFPDRAAQAWRQSAMISVLDRIRDAHEGWIGRVSREAGLPVGRLHDAQRRVAEAGAIHPSAVPSLQAVKRYAGADEPELWVATAAARNRLRSACGPDTHPAFPDLAEVASDLSALGAVLVLAHPSRYGWKRDHLESILRTMQAHGLQGMEAAYVPRADDAPWLVALAHSLGLTVTIGSDVHDLPNTASYGYAEPLRRIFDSYAQHISQKVLNE